MKTPTSRIVAARRHPPAVAGRPAGRVASRDAAPADEVGTTAIAAALRERIASGALPMGARLSDQVLAAEMQVSRTPVREALLRLRSEGLVTAKPQSGTFVFQPGTAEIAEICQLRAVYEAGAVNLALSLDRASLLVALREVIQRAQAALRKEDWATCESCDTAFHEAIVGASGNRLLIEAYRAMSGKVRALRHGLPQAKARFVAAHAQHVRILDLLDENRAAAAQRELVGHLDNVAVLLGVTDGSADVMMRDATNKKTRAHRRPD